MRPKIEYLNIKLMLQAANWMVPIMKKIKVVNTENVFLC